MADSPSLGLPGCAGCVRLQRQVDELEQRLADLEERLNRSPANSSTPPASVPTWVKPPVKKKPTGRRPGGQPGHPGHHRQLLAPGEVDQVVTHRPAACPHCQEALPADAEQNLIGRHQVMELPRRPVIVTEHQAIACRCPGCGRWAPAPIPASIRRYTMGERLSAVAGYVCARVHGSRRSAEELLQEVLGVPISLGSVAAREEELSLALSEPYEQVKTHVRAARAKNVDETGWKRAGRWLWVAATQTATFFKMHRNRNVHAMRDLLGETVQGTICTDRFGVYEYVPIGQRALCWAHLRRDFTKLQERGGASGTLGEQGLAICDQVHQAWWSFKDGRIERPGLVERVEPIRQAMKQLLERGLACGEKKAIHFCKHLLKLEQALWTFARIEGIEPTNNHAERMIRPAVMWRKQSLGSHSQGGCRFVERMMTVIQTLRLRRRSLMDFLEQSIQSLRHGLPPPCLVN